MASVNTHQISSKDIRELLKFFSSTNYKSKDTIKRTEQIESICIQLISKDYPNHIVITNEKGELSNSYPSKIVIPEINENTPPISRSNTLTNEVPSKLNYCNSFNDCKSNGSRKLDATKLKELMCKARVARCRARFPIPVIMYNNKYICRSATLSSGAEIYGRSVYDYTFNDFKNYSRNSNNEHTFDDEELVESIEDYSPPVPRSLAIGDSSQLFSKVRNQDIKLLKYFAVDHICDLMLEKKKVKFGMNVTSSEKADKENRYSDFNIISLPYPGCEFFREYRDNSYSGEGLIYDWNQNFVDAKFDLPNCDEISKQLRINFNDYRSWDVIKLTCNYIKLLLYFIREFDSSILIHCISGWDRTPLFMSLLRLTLWADGEIHKSLSAEEITYLTVAYDWFLFGHNLNDRLNKGEEIMFFCFQFLKFLTGDEFSINYELSKNNLEINDSKRKISMDGYSNGEDFFIPNIPASYKGSCTSLNSSSSLVGVDSLVYFPISDNKSEDIFSSSFSPSDIERLKINSNENLNLSNSVCFVENNVDDSSMSPHKEMTSTLTSSDKLMNHNSQLQETNFPDNDLHSSTKPVEIPNSKNNSSKSGLSGSSLSSLCRSDSWQLVTDAGSIREQYMFNQFSSPDSLNSLHRKSNSPSNNSVRCYNSLGKQSPKIGRKEKLLEVRSLFNCAYTSLSCSYNNGCRLTNLVDHFVGRVYSTRHDSPQ